MLTATIHLMVGHYQKGPWTSGNLPRFLQKVKIFIPKKQKAIRALDFGFGVLGINEAGTLN